MAHTALKKITAEAKRLQKKHPQAKWKNLVKQAGAKYRAGKIGATKKRAVKKKATAKRKSKGKRKTRVTTVTQARVIRVVGQHKRLKSRRRGVGIGRKVVYRRVGGSGMNMNKLMPVLLLGALGLGLYFILKPKQQTTQLPPTAPPLVVTTNPVRNTQANDILQYALAGGMAIQMITQLINSLNNKSDSEVNAIKQNIDAGYGLPSGLWV